jgi:hypothetical protein
VADKRGSSADFGRHVRSSPRRSKRNENKAEQNGGIHVATTLAAFELNQLSINANAHAHAPLESKT